MLKEYRYFLHQLPERLAGVLSKAARKLVSTTSCIPPSSVPVCQGSKIGASFLGKSSASGVALHSTSCNVSCYTGVSSLLPLRGWHLLEREGSVLCWLPTAKDIEWWAIQHGFFHFAKRASTPLSADLGIQFGTLWYTATSLEALPIVLSLFLSGPFSALQGWGSEFIL